MSRIVLIGAGAIGTVYADKLSMSRLDFKIAADYERVEKYEKEGILFCGKKIDVSFFTPKKNDESADLILICVKNYSLKDAMEIVAPIVGEKTIIIPLLNGITSEERVASRFGKEHVLYGYYIGHTSTRIGNDSHQDGNYLTVIGDYPYDKENSINLNRAIDILQAAKINVEARKNMKSELWKKFAVNITLNQTTAFFNCNYGEILESGEKMELFRSLALEIEQIAAKEKITGADNFSNETLNVLRKMNPEDRSSMAQDVMAGRKTEVEDFAGEVIRLGIRHNVPTPANEKIYRHFLE